jgi:hypothetical protein
MQARELLQPGLIQELTIEDNCAIGRKGRVASDPLRRLGSRPNEHAGSPIGRRIGCIGVSDNCCARDPTLFMHVLDGLAEPTKNIMKTTRNNYSDY